MSLQEKFRTLMTVIRHNGGIKKSFITLFRTDDLKWGNLVGTDSCGNKYYENDKYFIGRNRWIIYSNTYGWDYDGSQVPPEWHRWLHYMTDESPISKPPTRQKWHAEHSENLTLDPTKKYVPYSTTKPKIESWIPPK